MAVESNDNVGSGLSVDIGDELSKNITLHKNVKQQLILTTVDKIKLVLMETEKYRAASKDWITPVGLSISFITTLLTSEFKDSLGLTKEIWHALFMLMTLGSLVWLVFKLIACYNGRGKGSHSDIIKQIQLTDEVQQQN
ncbi:hypothetical protein [Pedobacter borealis]|uniref:hypothetical protein n=1 Tax=Pedobacter borealis TaxID=475254 RepID=UPI00049312E4|nr:hypothetical protein [Pedobacter borealis]